MNTTMKTVIVEPNALGRLALKDVDAPSPRPWETLVRVSAISLNRGEVRRAQSAEAGWRPGWDLAGTVERAAADGSGPPAGARVVGLLASGAWAELAAVPGDALAVLPASVSLSQAATLPVAGLTALLALEKGRAVFGGAVLITGASGGVGHFACQLAHHTGARVVGAVRQPKYVDIVKASGADHVVVGDDAAAAREFGPYDLILDSVGGRTLGNALSMLASNGICVNFGSSAAPEVTFSMRDMFLTGGASLYGFYLFHELRGVSASSALARLTRLVGRGQLVPHIDVEAPWTEIGDLATRLIERRFAGKAVLRVEHRER